MFIGDDHQLIDDTAALSQKRLDCKVYKRKTYHKETGYFQVHFHSLACVLGSCASSMSLQSKQSISLLPSQAEFNQESTTQRCQAAMHLLADMELMARADYFVGNAIYICELAPCVCLPAGNQQRVMRCPHTCRLF